MQFYQIRIIPYTNMKHKLESSTGKKKEKKKTKTPIYIN